MRYSKFRKINLRQKIQILQAHNATVQKINIYEGIRNDTICQKQKNKKKSPENKTDRNSAYACVTLWLIIRLLPGDKKSLQRGILF